MTKTIEHFAIEQENSDVRIRLHELLTPQGEEPTPEVRAERETLEKRLEAGRRSSMPLSKPCRSSRLRA